MSTLTLPTPRVFLPLLDNPRRYLGAAGGRASGKSHFFAELMVETHLMRPGYRALCGREVQKSLKDSAKRLIEDKIQAMGVGHRFEVLQTEIRSDTGGTINFIGLQDHTAESIKSFEGADVCWVEEAQTITARSLGLLDPTIRKPGSQLWLSWNPRKRGDAVEKLPWNDPAWATLVRANYHDNPFLDETMIALALKAKEMDEDTYNHVWLGGYEAMGSNVVIPPAWVEAAIGLAQDLRIDVTGKRYGALDVAGGDEGGDENALAIRKGIELRNVETWNGLDGELTLKRALASCEANGIDTMMYDPVGVGESVTTAWAGMGRRRERPHGFRLVPWNGGAAVPDGERRVDPRDPRSPKRKDQYHNLKAASGFDLRKRFENAWLARQGREYDPDMLISLRRGMKGLRELQDELSQPQHKLSATGKTMVDKKPDGAKSPNRYDAVVAAFAPLGGGYAIEAFG